MTYFLKVNFFLIYEMLRVSAKMSGRHLQIFKFAIEWIAKIVLGDCDLLFEGQ